MNFKTIVRKIEKLEIQGATDVATNAMKALRVRLEEKEPKNKKEAIKVLENAKERLFNTRPTEPLMRNSVKYIISESRKAEDVEEIRRTVKKLRSEFFEFIEGGKEKIAEVGSRRISGNVLTYCHSSTVMGVLRESKGDIDKVYATETRPKWQGRITVKELVEAEIPTTMIVDGATRYVMKDVDYVIVGADVITSEGNIVNKIGTSLVALAANEARVPFYVATNLLKFDPETKEGVVEKIEERDWEEIWGDLWDEDEKPEGWTEDNKKQALAFLDFKNPAFDITPKEYIDGLITEDGIISPEMVIESVRKKFPFVLEE